MTNTLSTMAVGLARRGNATALRYRQGDTTIDVSYRDFGERVTRIARGLIALGIGSGDGVAVLGATRPEWTASDLAALAAGATVVPIYNTNSSEECAYVLAHSGARAVICEDADQVAKVEAVREQCPALEHVIGMQPGATALSLDDVAARADEVAAEVLDERVAAVHPSDVATMVYTSGTTGPPKGCMLTHANCRATMDMYEERLELGGQAVIFLFLPLAHVLARMTQMVALDVGGTLAYWSGDAAELLDDIAAAQPTHVPSVPRVFEKIRTRALASVEDAGGAKRKLFDWALATGARARAAERAGGAGPLLKARHAIADRLVLSKVRGLFGGKLELALSGAAPIAADVLEFFDACGVLVVEGWGMTETCAAGTLNTPEAFRFGSVGRALPGTDVTTAEDGEILVKGPSVFPGYHRDPDATAAVLDGGWLFTGDLGEIDADGFVRITGRKKDLIITSSGKNISPSNIESMLRESRWISQAMVIGDNKPYLVALLTLDAEEVSALAPDAVLAAVQEDVDEVNGRLARIEQVKRFTLLDRDLSQEAGELTPTLKVKRPVVAEHFGDEITALYA